MKTGGKVVRLDRASKEGAGIVATEEFTLAEQVYRALRKDIVSGALKAAQPLRLEYLKERYGISFSPIREALNRLQSERLVETTSSRGFRVAPFSIEEMWDAIETRVVIESEAVRRSLANADDEWEARMVGAFHALSLAGSRVANRTVDDAQEEEILETKHFEFHRGIMSACGSRWLIELSAQMYAQTERYRRPGLRGRSGKRGSRNVPDEHQLILDAALARDSDKTVALLAQHYRETGRMIAAASRASEKPVRTKSGTYR